MEKILFIGSLGSNDSCVRGGVEAKNRQLKFFLEKEGIRVKCINTYNWKYNMLKILLQILKSVFIDKYKKIVISIYTDSAYKLLMFFNCLISLGYKFDIYYFVAGGNIHNIIQEKKFKIKYYKRIKKIYVQTSGIKEKLDFLNSDNIEVIPNFKNFNYKSKNLIKDDKVFNCVYIGRITQEKGIGFLFDNLEKIDGNIKIDFYGPIDNDFKEYFFKKIDNEKFFYKGILNFNDEKSYSILNTYKLFIFPTYYSDEGFPGVIIDAYIAGIPILASDWNYNPELIENYKNGLLFKTNDPDDFIEKLNLMRNNLDLLEKIAANNREKAKKFLPQNCLRKFLDEIK